MPIAYHLFQIGKLMLLLRMLQQQNDEIISILGIFKLLPW